MSLSERERQEPAALEKRLIEDDPVLARRLRDASLFVHMSGHPVLSSLIVLLGYILIIIGLGAQSALIGLLGLALTIRGCVWLISDIWSSLDHPERQEP